MMSLQDNVRDDERAGEPARVGGPASPGEPTMRVVDTIDDDDRVVHIDTVRRTDREYTSGVPARPSAHSEGERSLGELFGELSRDTSTLVRQEVKLAKTEITEKAKTVGKDVAYMAIGGALAYAGLLVLLAAAVIALAYVIPAWLSALLVGIVVVGIGAFLAYKGMSDLKNAELAPKQTIQSLQEDKEWAREQVQ